MSASATWIASLAAHRLVRHFGTFPFVQILLPTSALLFAIVVLVPGIWGAITYDHANAIFLSGFVGICLSDFCLHRCLELGAAVVHADVIVTIIFVRGDNQENIFKHAECSQAVSAFKSAGSAALIMGLFPRWRFKQLDAKVFLQCVLVGWMGNVLAMFFLRVARSYYNSDIVAVMRTTTPHMLLPSCGSKPASVDPFRPGAVPR